MLITRIADWRLKMVFAATIETDSCVAKQSFDCNEYNQMSQMA